MKLNFFYGKKPGVKNFNPRDFSERAYDCHALFQNKRGMPVAVSRHKENDIWKVQDGFSAVFFGTKAEALAYCRGRFFDEDGRAV